MWTKLPVSVWLLQISIQIITCTNRRTHLRGKGLNRVKSVPPDWLYFPEVRAYHSDLMCEWYYAARKGASKKIKGQWKGSPACCHFLCKVTGALGSQGTGYTQTSTAAADGLGGCMCTSTPAKRNKRERRWEIKVNCWSSSTWKANTMAWILPLLKPIRKLIGFKRHQDMSLGMLQVSLNLQLSLADCCTKANVPESS